MHQITPRLMNWASILEEKTQEQALRTSQMPFVFPHLALMPDAHLGLGATVGSVIPTERAVMPAAVGVDIGCGMIAVLTQFTAADLGDRSLTPLRESIERAIPLSAGAANQKIVATAQPRIDELEAHGHRRRVQPRPAGRAVAAPARHARLGQPLHRGEPGRAGPGLGCSCTRVRGASATRSPSTTSPSHGPSWSGTGSTLPDRDLAYLVEGTDEFWAYIRELRWAQHYALLNREEMMDRVIRQLGEFLGTPVVESTRVNCHHNFTQQETHWGKQVWVTPEGRHRGAGGPARPDPGFDGDRGPTSSRARATRCRSAPPRTAPAGSSAGAQRGSGSPTTSSGRR